MNGLEHDRHVQGVLAPSLPGLICNPPGPGTPSSLHGPSPAHTHTQNRVAFWPLVRRRRTHGEVADLEHGLCDIHGDGDASGRRCHRYAVTRQRTAAPHRRQRQAAQRTVAGRVGNGQQLLQHQRRVVVAPWTQQRPPAPWSNRRGPGCNHPVVNNVHGVQVGLQGRQGGHGRCVGQRGTASPQHVPIARDVQQPLLPSALHGPPAPAGPLRPAHRRHRGSGKEPPRPHACSDRKRGAMGGVASPHS